MIGGLGGGRWHLVTLGNSLRSQALMGQHLSQKVPICRLNPDCYSRVFIFSMTIYLIESKTIIISRQKFNS